MSDVACLEAHQLSLLQSLFASATHDASAAMCCWTNSLIRLTLDEVCEIPLQNVCADLHFGDEPLTMVVLTIEGDAGGALILTFNEEAPADWPPRCWKPASTRGRSGANWSDRPCAKRGIYWAAPTSTRLRG